MRLGVVGLAPRLGVVIEEVVEVVDERNVVGLGDNGLEVRLDVF